MSWNISNQLGYIEAQIADISGLTDPLTNPLDCGNQNLYNIDDVLCNNDVTCNQLNYVTLNPPLPTTYRPLNNYYVAPNGSDVSGNGSILSPFQTISKAITYAGLYAPDIPTEIFIYAGTYVENITSPLYNLSFTAYNGGTGGDNEVLPNQSVVLQGSILITGTATTPINVPTTFNNIYFKNSKMNLNFLVSGNADFSIEFNNCSFLIDNSTSAGFIFTGNSTNNYNCYFNNCDVRFTSNNIQYAVFIITSANFYMNNSQMTGALDRASFFNFVFPTFNPNTIRFNGTTITNTSTAPNNYYIVYFDQGCTGSIINSNFIFKSTATAPEQSAIFSNGGTFDNFYNNQFICPGCTTLDPSGNICMLQFAGPSTTMVLNNCYNNYGLPGRTGFGVYTNNITFNALQEGPVPVNTITDISSGNAGIQVSAQGTRRLISNLGVLDISGSAGINISGTKTKYQINNLGVLDLSGSLGIQITGSKTQYQINNLGIIDISNGNTGISISGPKNGRLITNTGVNDISGGNGISISGTKPATQTIINTGVVDLSGGSGIQLLGSKPVYQITNTGVLDLSGSSGISITGTKTKYQINNLGVTQLTAGSGISLSAQTGNISISTNPVWVPTATSALNMSNFQIDNLGDPGSATDAMNVRNCQSFFNSYVPIGNGWQTSNSFNWSIYQNSFGTPSNTQNLCGIMNVPFSYATAGSLPPASFEINWRCPVSAGWNIYYGVPVLIRCELFYSNNGGFSATTWLATNTVIGYIANTGATGSPYPNVPYLTFNVRLSTKQSVPVSVTPIQTDGIWLNLTFCTLQGSYGTTTQTFNPNFLFNQSVCDCGGIETTTTILSNTTGQGF